MRFGRAPRVYLEEFSLGENGGSSAVTSFPHRYSTEIRILRPQFLAVDNARTVPMAYGPHVVGDRSPTEIATFCGSRRQGGTLVGEFAYGAHM